MLLPRPARCMCTPRRAVLLFRGIKSLLNFRPVYYVPPRGDVFGTSVLILQIIGVLPHIQPPDRIMPIHHRTVLVRRRNNLDPATLLDQPRPARPEARRRRRVEFLFERIEAAERLVNRLCNIPAWRPSGLRR